MDWAWAASIAVLPTATPTIVPTATDTPHATLSAAATAVQLPLSRNEGVGHLRLSPLRSLVAGLARGIKAMRLNPARAVAPTAPDDMMYLLYELNRRMSSTRDVMGMLALKVRRACVLFETLFTGHVVNDVVAPLKHW